MPTHPKAVIALSGGVDSAVAAILLHHQNWDLQGVHLRLTSSSSSEDWVRTLARRLEIPLKLIDLQLEFSREVLDYFVSEYSRGRTPNPCVRCNVSIKFGHLWEILRQQGYMNLATGHYARLQPVNGDTMALLRGVDRRKDQSYFLSRLPRTLLSNLLFPLGELNKDEVRRIYQAKELPVRENQQESMELCFIPEGSYQDFLRAQRGFAGPPGDFINAQGRLLGRHRGLECYTVGQRRGLGISATEPYYVTEIQPASNRVVLGPRSGLFSSGLLASQMNWLIDPPAADFDAMAVIRYRHPGVWSRISLLRADEVQVEFETPQAAVAPGQAVVFYDRGRVLGSGWIDEKIK